MNKALTALVIGISICTTQAYAGGYSQKERAMNEENINDCDVYADLRLEQHRSSSMESETIRSGANLLGAIIGDRDIGYAAESTIRRHGYGVANDARMMANRRDQYFNQCMREKRADALRRK